MNKPTFKLNSAPLAAPQLKWHAPAQSGKNGLPQEKSRKFAFGYYFGKRNGFTFRALAEQYAPYLKEVYFPWPGLLSARELEEDVASLREKLVDDLKFCRSKGLALDLLANATCYGDKSFTAAQREEYFGYLKDLASHGLLPEIVTTTSPFLAKITKKFDASIERRASVNMRLNSTLAMEYISNEFDSFYICRDIQRDLPTLKLFSEWGKKNGKSICMLANSGCLRYCPWQTFHETLLAHDFRHAQPELKKVGLKSTLCMEVFINKQYEELLRGSWIRPEDLHRYEPYVSVIKLSTREADRPDLILKAYTSGSFDGNLFLLLDPCFTFLSPLTFLDNKAFPKEWSEGKIAGLCANDCTHCGKCAEVLKRALKRDPDLPDITQYSLSTPKTLKVKKR